jgi:transposase
LNHAKNLGTLGIDEIAIKTGHQSFVTMISSKTNDDRLKVIVTISGRLKEDVKAFLESIPAELKKTVKQACTDIYDGYVTAAIEVFGVQSLVIDRYHVSKLYCKPFEEIGISTNRSR